MAGRGYSAGTVTDRDRVHFADATIGCEVGRSECQRETVQVTLLAKMGYIR